jgi:hypothetical protein
MLYGIQAVVWKTERDSANMVSSNSRQIARGIINTFDAVLTYRKTIDLLRKVNQEKGNKYGNSRKVEQ